VPKRDLLESGPTDPHFVAETEADGRAWLRFGDDKLGLRPEPETSFTATYRVGNGVAGNVGAESIAHLSTADSALASAVSLVRNPLPAQGGVEPESMEAVREYAPAAFRTQARAVTEADYAKVTERHPEVQRAVATFRWTGSWHTVFITVDRMGGLLVDDPFKGTIRQFVERFRMAGYDLEVDGPRFVSLDIEMHVCVHPDYFRMDVKQTLLGLFSNRLLPNGRRGLFHPDNFTFGQTVYLSPLIAAAQAVLRQRQPAELILQERIRTRDVDQQLGLVVQDSLDPLLQLLEVFAVGRAIADADVEVALRLPRRVIVLLVNGEREHALVTRETDRGPVPLVHVAVNDRRARDARVRLEHPDGDGDVVLVAVERPVPNGGRLF